MLYTVATECITQFMQEAAILHKDQALSGGIIVLDMGERAENMTDFGSVGHVFWQIFKDIGTCTVHLRCRVRSDPAPGLLQS